MTQFKDKSQRDGADRATVGLFTYPILQAADILIYRANQVPVGEDQKQHLELTRDLAQRFNSTYGETLVLPETLVLSEGSKVLDLANPLAKMSKSSPAGCVFLLDDAPVVTKKFMAAVTDSGAGIEFDPKNKPGVANLLTILASVSNREVSDCVHELSGKGYGDLKKAVAEAVVTEVTEPTRTKANELLKDRGQLMKLLHDGAAKARAVASDTLNDVYQKVGFLKLANT
jgi:tryptophanyl-tRNA synthetase